MVSSTVPVLHNLAANVLKQLPDDTELTKAIKKKIIDYLNDKYAEPTIQGILHIATFLDPRFKLDYVEGVDRQILEDSILDEGMQIVTSTPTTLQTSQESEQSLPVPKRKS